MALTYLAIPVMTAEAVIFHGVKLAFSDRRCKTEIMLSQRSSA